MVWNASAAVEYAKKNAQPHSVRKCAEYTRQAIAAGGVNIGNTLHAKNYGPLLERAGFRTIDVTEQPRTGDVVIIQPYKGGNLSGHMAIYDGHFWYSDFRQRDIWSGPGYRTLKPAMKVYRKN